MFFIGCLINCYGDFLGGDEDGVYEMSRLKKYSYIYTEVIDIVRRDGLWYIL